MRPLLAPLTAALIAMLPLAAAAEPIGYVAGFDTLYRIDLATGRATAVGGIGFNDVEGLAFAPDGTLYGVADATAGAGSGVTDLLIRINPATGAGTLVAPLAGLAGLGISGNLDYGLAFTCDQRLWLSSDSTNQLWEVTPGTGATRFVANTGASLSGLAGRERELYGLSVGAQPTLYRITPADAQVAIVGPANVGGVVADAGLDFDAAGALWAALDPEPAAEGASRFARLELATGAGGVVSTSSVAAVGMEGLAIAPVPACTSGDGVVNVAVEPITVPGPGLPMLAVLGAIAAAFGLRRLRPEGREA